MISTPPPEESSRSPLNTQPSYTPTITSGPPPSAPPPVGGTVATGGSVGRRALITVAALAACAAATPFVIQKGTDLAEAEMGQILQTELGDLEGVALDEAIRIAELTRQAVDLFVVPLARFLTTVSGDGLQAMADTVGHAITALNALHLPTDDLGGFETLLTTWKANEEVLPIALQSFADTDINGAATYLRALKAKVTSPKPL
jgi:hypothetical protein